MNFCVLGTDCTVYDRRHDLAAVTYGTPLCQGCRDALRGDLNGLRYDYIDLSQLLVPADGRNDAGKIFRPKPESKPNTNMAPWYLRDDIAWTVAITAIVVRRHTEPRPLRLPVLPVREGYRLDVDLRYLAERTDDIAGLPAIEAHWNADTELPCDLDGPAIVDRLRRLHSRARKMCGTDPRVITVPGYCQPCNTPSLRRHDDNPEIIWCVHCNRKMDAAEYGRMVRLQIPAPPSGD